ncbi:MAG: MlaD family protein [Victivallaceae bacterium]|nr:MlaD family protein [Victivallaceae bacterium]
MKFWNERTRTGAFTLGGVLLLLIMVYFLGASAFFEKKVKFVTLFNESVQGLNVGAAVKYRGVPVGTVSKITIQMDNNLILVEMDILPGAFVSLSPTPGRKRGAAMDSFHTFFMRELKNNLRCRTEFAGITGLKYIEFNHFNDGPARKPLAPPPHLRSDEYYIASIPSPLSDMMRTLSRSMESIAKIDFEGISKNLIENLSELQDLLSDPALKATLNHIQSISRNIEGTTGTITTVLTEDRLEKMVHEIENALGKSASLIATIDQAVKDARISERSRTFQDVGHALIEGKNDLAGTLRELNETLAAANALLEVLNRDPSALLRGRKE